MANELLKSPEGDAVPQNLKDGVSVSASDLDGDDTVWEIFDDPAQGGGSTLQDVVDDLNGTLEVTDDGSFNATVSGTVGLEADDGSGTVGGIQQTNNALDVYLSAQNGNFSVDLQNDAVGLAGSVDATFQGTSLGDIAYVKGDTGEVKNISRDPHGIIGETEAGESLQLTTGDARPISYRISYALVSA